MKEEMEQENNKEDTYVDNKSNMVTMNVIIRVRPLTQKQKTLNAYETIKIMNYKNLVLLDQHQEDTQKKNRSRETKFSFDYIYDRNISTKDIYDKSISNLLDGILNGYNSTIIAYGATGCGKTYTMIGQQGKQGIFALTMIDLLGRANQQRHSKNITIKLSYVEIYNEIVKDLLISQDKNLQIREDSKEVQIIGATQVLITSMIELNIVLKVGSANRSKDSTVSNEVSSRSHAILMIKVESKDKDNSFQEEKETCIGKFLLVDLAGSQKSAWQKGSKQIQGSKINRSLLTLGNCIQILAQANGKFQYTPYRQSKLTRLLKESLGGNCKTTMIINISPFISSWEQTYNSLLYGNRAKNIKNASFKVAQTEGNSSNYISLINNLKRQNDDLKKQLKNHNKNSTFTRYLENNSLPQLKIDPLTNNEQKQADKVRIKIKNHFEQELKIIKIISELTIKIDKLAFRLYSIEIDSKPIKNKSLQKNERDKKENKLKEKIGDLSKQKMNFEDKLQLIAYDRSDLISQIKSSQLNESLINKLMMQYRQKKIQLQLQEIKLRQKRIENQHNQKELFVKDLRQEVHIRDKIIQDQKILIQKNNIVNRITYSKINFGHKEQEIPRLLEKLSVKRSFLPENHQKEVDQSSYYENDKGVNHYKYSVVNNPKEKMNKKHIVKVKRQKSIGSIMKNNLTDEPSSQIISKRQKIPKNRSKLQLNNFISLER